MISTYAAANLGTRELKAGESLDLPSLSVWMQSHIHGFQGPISVSRFKGGQSNPTYKLVTPNGSFVLRSKPAGDTHRGAHAVDREAHVQTALFKQDFPVAEIFGYCADLEVIGSEFYLMQLVEGRIFWDARFPEVALAERRAYFDAMNTTLAKLHRIDPDRAGLGNYGRKEAYFERQIARWSKQYLADDIAGRNADMDQLIEWLPEHIPEQQTLSIIHGDFRCDNMIFHPTEPRILAVLDWELSTLGDPLADFAYHAMMYRMPPDIVAGLMAADIAALNIPTETQYIEKYCQQSGIASIPNYEFYIAFNFFRLAAIFHGIKGRVLRGNASSDSALERAEAFPRLARFGLEALEAF